MSNKPPILDDWQGYVFAEESITSLNHRLTVADPVTNPSPSSYAPMRFDKPQDGVSGTMADTAQKIDVQFRTGTSIAKVPLCGDGLQVAWLLFSPYELFMEQVLAEGLKRLEIGDLG